MNNKKILNEITNLHWIIEGLIWHEHINLTGIYNSIFINISNYGTIYIYNTMYYLVSQSNTFVIMGFVVGFQILGSRNCPRTLFYATGCSVIWYHVCIGVNIKCIIASQNENI